MAYTYLIIIGVILLWAIITFNGFIRLRNAVKKSWAGIDVQLKRRADLIPNLVKTVKGYAKHEKTLLENITKERTALMDSLETKDAKAVNKANKQLAKHVKQLFAVAENYPKLQASKNFMKLQDELSNTENEISASRRIYNENVTYMNDSVQVFPRNMIAKLFGFKQQELFATSAKANVKVKF